MLDNIHIPNILFFDIETVPMAPNFEKLSEKYQMLWKYKTDRFKPEEETDIDYFFKKAGVYAEFGKIICISAGYFRRPKEEEDEMTFRVTSFYGDEEQTLLQQFFQVLTNYFNIPSRSFICGHNIREFDIPFLCRRAIIHQLPIPKLIDVHALKPWELPFIDTMRLWKFGDYKNFTSLDLLTTLLDIPSPKSDMQGSEVAKVYYEDNDIERIKDYCQRDVIALANVLLKFKNKDLLKPEQIIEV